MANPMRTIQIFRNVGAAIAAVLWFAALAHAAETFAKSYRVGDLIKLTASESVGWDVESGLSVIPFDVSDDQTACYIGTGPVPTRFVVKASGIKTLANGKSVPHVLARYVVTIASDGPAPGPIPPGPTPTPTPTPTPNPPPDVPNAMGVGVRIYQAAAAVGDKPACLSAAASLTNSATGLDRSAGSEAAIDAAVKTVTAALRSAMAGAKWDAARKSIEQTLTAASAGGLNAAGYAHLFREAAAGFAAAGR